MSVLKLGCAAFLALVTVGGVGHAQRARSVTIVSTLTDEGVECQAIHAANGRLYTLSGDLRGLQTGDRVRVKGSVAEISTCMQGTTITVGRIKELNQNRQR